MPTRSSAFLPPELPAPHRAASQDRTRGPPWRRRVLPAGGPVSSAAGRRGWRGGQRGGASRQSPQPGPAGPQVRERQAASPFLLRELPPGRAARTTWVARGGPRAGRGGASAEPDRRASDQDQRPEARARKGPDDGAARGGRPAAPPGKCANGGARAGLGTRGHGLGPDPPTRCSPWAPEVGKAGQAAACSGPGAGEHALRLARRWVLAGPQPHALVRRSVGAERLERGAPARGAAFVLSPAGTGGRGRGALRSSSQPGRTGRGGTGNS